MKFEEFERLVLENPEARKGAQEAAEEYEIAQCIAKIRKAAKLTQRQLSTNSGIKQPQIARLESGRNSPKLDTLAKIARSAGYSCEITFKPKDEDGREDISCYLK